jgi:Fe-only nitrogenase accessory protein AnfO
MIEKVAVIMGQDGYIGVIESKSMIDLYTKTEDEWQLFNRVEVLIKDSSNIEEVRRGVRKTVLELEDCRIILGKNVSGVAYHILDRLGFYIFEADTYYPEMFDEIIYEVEKTEGEEDRGENIPIAPYSPNQDGIYYLDLIELQNRHPDISSKKAISQFINNQVFMRFELICRHMPPWMEQVIERRKLKCTIEKQGEDICKVILSYPGCRGR